MPRKAKDEIKDKKNNSIIEKLVKKAKSNKKTSKNIKASEGTSKKSAKKTSATKSKKTSSSQKTTTKSKTTKSPARKKVAKKDLSIEYYDLPLSYNQTNVKILAQTPNVLFIYWDISEDDKKSYMSKYGDDFFNNTRPYLIITNETMNYTFEVEINDFANSWYLHVNDANCKYKVELIRKFTVSSDNNLQLNSTINDNIVDNSKKELTTTKSYAPYKVNDRVSIAFSNNIDAPNNRILFDKLGHTVFFRNIKTDILEEKSISSLSFIQNIGKIYNVYDLYKEIYHDEFVATEDFGVNLPSSSSSSSSFK